MATDELTRGLRRQLLDGFPADAILGAVERARLPAQDCAEAIAAVNRQGRDAFARRRSSADYAYFMIGVRRRLRTEASHEVDEVQEIGEEAFYQEHYELNRPVLMRRLYPRCAAYSFDALVAEFGDVTVTVSRGRSAAPFLEASPKRVAERLALRDYVREATTSLSDDHYVTGDGRAVLGPLGALLGRLFPENAVLRASAPEDASLWLGPEGAITPFHFDVSNVVVAQILGRKHVYLAAPDQYAFMYAEPALRASPVDPRRPDLSAFPRFRFAEILEVDLEPGDALFIPVAWWHAIVSARPSFSASLTAFRRPNVFAPERAFAE